MKKEELQSLGLTDEQIGKLFELNGKDINKAKSDVQAEMQTKIDGLSAQLTTAQDGLKKFEGIDPEKLNGEITKLNQQIATQKADYEKQLADRDFNDLLKNSIGSAKGKNVKAITALLNVDELKTSKNQKEDIQSALNALKAENDYLFDSDEPHRNAVTSTSNGASSTNSFTTDSEKVEAARRVMGLPSLNNKEGK